jgi:hypothetical protein
MRLMVDDAAALSDVVAVIAKSGGSVAHLSTTVRSGARLAAELEVRTRDIATSAAVTAAVADTPGIEIAESSSQEE